MNIFWHLMKTFSESGSYVARLLLTHTSTRRWRGTCLRSEIKFLIEKAISIFISEYSFHVQCMMSKPKATWSVGDEMACERQYWLMLLLLLHKKESSSFAGSSICSKLIKQNFVIILLHSSRYHGCPWYHVGLHHVNIGSNEPHVSNSQKENKCFSSFTYYQKTKSRLWALSLFAGLRVKNQN